MKIWEEEWELKVPWPSHYLSFPIFPCKEIRRLSRGYGSWRVGYTSYVRELKGAM